MDTYAPLLPYVRKFFEYDPLTATHALEGMPEPEAVRILSTLPPTLSAKIFNHLQVNQAAALLQAVPTETLKSIVENLNPEHGASIFINIADEGRSRLLEHLSEKAKSEIQELLTYPKGSVGSIMTTRYVVFHSDVKTKDVIESIRTRARMKAPPSSYVYVINHENQLVGVLNMRDLIIADGEETLDSIMIRDVFSINAFTDREDACDILSKRKYFAAPVVDNKNHLLGIVKADQLIGEVTADASADMVKMFGASSSERSFSSISFALRKRLPWLHINLATAFLAASVVSLFEGIIAKITVLAIFLPIVAGQGGNAGSQSLAVVMRGLVLREISPNEVWKLVFKEVKLGLINGLVIGLVTALIAWLWKGNPFLGVVIGLAMIVNLAAAGFSGAIIPITMKAMRLDPAQSSSIILTTVTDVIGFFAFLGFAVIFQSFLI